MKRLLLPFTLAVLLLPQSLLAQAKVKHFEVEKDTATYTGNPWVFTDENRLEEVFVKLHVQRIDNRQILFADSSKVWVTIVSNFERTGFFVAGETISSTSEEDGTCAKVYTFRWIDSELAGAIREQVKKLAQKDIRFTLELPEIKDPPRPKGRPIYENYGLIENDYEIRFELEINNTVVIIED